MNSIIWRGVASTTIEGLLISELPPITKPKMRTKETEIDGRDGSTIEELGYETYTKTVKIGLYGNFDIDKVIKYFTGEGDIIFSNEPDKVYKAKICGKIDYTRLLRYRKASIPFLVQPYKYKLNEYLRETQTETVSGTNIVVNNREDDILKSFKIYGKSTQDGIPTPEAPIDIVSVGDDGSISVTVNDKIIDLPIANTLRAVQVTDKSIATYTDASGKMWCADEIDLKRCCIVRRIQRITFDKIKEVYRAEHPTGSGIYRFNMAGTVNNPIVNVKFLSHNFGLSNALTYSNSVVGGNAVDNCVSVYYVGGIYARCDSIATAEEFLTTARSENWEVFAILETPIETPLTDEQIALLKKMDLSKPSTITNDENAYMSVEYFKPFEVFNEGLEDSKPLMILKGSGTVEISVNGVGIFSYTFPDGENEVYIDSEKEDAYLGDVLKNRNMNGEFPVLIPRTNKIEWSGDIESISILPRSRWL